MAFILPHPAYIPAVGREFFHLSCRLRSQKAYLVILKADKKNGDDERVFVTSPYDQIHNEKKKLGKGKEEKMEIERLV